MKKRFLCLLLSASVLCSLCPALAAGAEKDGAAEDGRWIEQDGLTYYLDKYGTAVTGWQQIDGQEYYFTQDGSLAHGWQGIDGERYYFGEDGLPCTGLRYVPESENMYLFSDEGTMQRSMTVTLLGKEYEIDAKGVIVGYATPASAEAAAVLDEVGWDLRSAFDWASSALPYSGRYNRAPEGSVHSEWYAMYGFENGYGNCYVMAAAFYQMAKILGYEAYYIEGGVGSTTGTVIDHSWTELVIDGETYVFDPDFTNETGLDGYQIWYEKKDTWWYFDPVRVD